jgi:hypothetical protein
VGCRFFIEFLGRIGLVEQLASRTPYQPKSGNHYDPGQILVGFILKNANRAAVFSAALAPLIVKRFIWPAKDELSSLD